MKPLKSENTPLKTNFLVGDIETLIIDNRHKPYAIGFYDINQIPDPIQITFCDILRDFNDESTNLIGNAFLTLFRNHTKRKKDRLIFNQGNTLTLLFHNMGKFDGLLILKSMFINGLSKIEKDLESNYPYKYTVIILPLIRNRTIYQIQVKLSYQKKVKNKVKTISKVIFNIVDSYLILPSSLNQLAKSFLGKMHQKESFDHSLVTPAWLKSDSNRSMSYQYLETDLRLLYDVVKAARFHFHKHFHIDILTRLTLPSIALTIFRKHYLEKATLKALNKQSFIDSIDYKKNSDYLIPDQNHPSKEKFIRLSYMGGRVDVFKPHFIQDKYGLNLNLYDVNSLYPYVMKSLMPCGQPTFIKGHALINHMLLKHKKLGFVEAIATAPIGLYIPILPIKYKINGDDRLLYPSGTFKGSWYSEEVLYALEVGYVFEFQCAMIYPEKHLIFQDYIDDIYKKRILAKQNGDAGMNFIYKLLLNSLYGRLGIQTDNLQTYVVDKKVSSAVLSHFDHSDVLHYDHHAMITLKYNQNNPTLMHDVLSNEERVVIEHITKHYNQTTRHGSSNCAVHLASAITSKARIEVAKIYTKYKQNVYYTDTDSIFIKGEIDSCFISDSTLGKWKHEATIKEAYFISPKSYAYIDVNDKETLKAKGALNKHLDFAFIKQNYYEQEHNRTQTITFPMVRLFNQLEIVQVTKSFQKSIHMTMKRKKVMNSENHWVDTEPLVMRYNHYKRINELINQT